MPLTTEAVVVDAPRPNAAPSIGNERARWRDHETYKALFVNPWTYMTGAVVLALLNIALVAATGKGWGVTTSLAYWGAWIWQAVGGDPHQWAYFAEVKPPDRGGRPGRPGDGARARMAFGCNIGDMFTAVPSMSLHGWVFMVSIFLGAAAGSKLLIRYFI